MFFGRIAHSIAEAQNLYDVVIIDCPPQLGYLTLSALSAATAVLITVHPQMLDVLSMAQFLTMTGDLLEVVADAGGTTNYDWMNYLVTRFEPSDGPQNQMVAFLRSIFGSHVLIHPMLKARQFPMRLLPIRHSMRWSGSNSHDRPMIEQSNRWITSMARSRP